jgi:nucleoside 2-deoxyribosyltransferase
MPTCFMIQPFDGGPFDKRFEDVIAPAIRAAGLDAYRVDQDPGVVVPIDQIEEGIRAAAACVADITTFNPNVWYELGYAIAAGKPVLLIALDEPNKRYPFDIQHRHVIRYKTDSARDFKLLASEITTRLSAVLEKEEKLERAVMAPSVADVEGLAQHELVALVTIAENLDHAGDHVSAHTIRNDMERSGFNRIAVTLALTVLVRKEFAEVHDAEDYNGNPYNAYSITEAGMSWLLNNQDTLALRKPAKSRTSVHHVDDDDDVPF